MYADEDDLSAAPGAYFGGMEEMRNEDEKLRLRSDGSICEL